MEARSKDGYNFVNSHTHSLQATGLSLFFHLAGKKPLVCTSDTVQTTKSEETGRGITFQPTLHLSETIILRDQRVTLTET